MNKDDISIHAERQKKRSKHQVTYNPEEGKTQQNMKDATNINTMVRNLGVTGQSGHPILSKPRQAIYGDFSNLGSYQENLNKIELAKKAFAELPSQARKYFHNNPARFYDFMGDDKNLEKARELGLLSEDHEEPKETPKAPEEPKTEV